MSSAAFYAFDLLERAANVRMTPYAYDVIDKIRKGPPVRDYWSSEHPVWMGLHSVREGEPSNDFPISPDTGHWLIRTFELIYEGSNSALAPVNPATRAICLYCLAHIALWVHDYYTWCQHPDRPESDLERNLEPFSNFYEGPKTCFRVLIGRIIGVFYEISQSPGELELVRLDVWHFSLLLPTIELLMFALPEYLSCEEPDFVSFERMIHILHSDHGSSFGVSYGGS